MGIARVEQGEVVVDTTSADIVRSYFEDYYQDRLFHPSDTRLGNGALKHQVQTWRESGKTIVFNSGVYDLLHANHKTFLLHTKLAAIPYRWDNQEPDHIDIPWQEVDLEERASYTRKVLSSDQIKLIVSVDGNMDVAERKGNRDENGNASRPFLDWSNRARDVLGIGYQLSPGIFLPIVDAVTIHDKIDPALVHTPHRGIMDIASYIRPDVWSIFEESEDVIEALDSTHKAMIENGTSARILNFLNYYTDPLLGGTI